MSRSYWLTLAALFALLVATFPNYAAHYVQEDGPEAPTQQEPTRITDSKFIVVYRYQPSAADPIVDLRIVLHAKSEGDAIVRATIHLATFRNAFDLDKLRFIEAAPFRPEEKKK